MKRLVFLLLLFICPILITAQDVSGCVYNTEGEKIPSANVMLYQKSDSTLLFGTTTNLDGIFKLEVKDIKKTFLRVSYVGYQTQNVEIKETPLVIVLEPLSLGEVIVSADIVKKNASSEVYIITDSLRKNCVNALQLFDKLRGIKIDWLNDAVNIGEYRDVPMMVEGKEVSAEYIHNINPKRIRKIEVLRNPKGKYGEAPIIMNVILNNFYEGFDLSANVKGMLSLRNKQSHNIGAGMTFTHATKKWNLYGDATVEDRQLFEAVSYEQIYKDNIESTETEDYNNPNGSNTLTDLNFSFGTDYKINPNHIVSLQTWISNSKAKEKIAYNNTDRSFFSDAFDDYNASNITTGIYYRGSISNRLYLSSDVTNNYYDVDENKQYTLLTNYSNQQYEGKKNYWRANVDARYVWNNWLNGIIGYTFTNKDYANYERPSHIRLFSSKESRHDTYLKINVNPARNINFVIGSNVLYVKEKNDILSDENISWMPLAKIFWNPFRIASINVDYYCDVQHPNLDQLSMVAYQRNSNLLHRGNPELKARVMHYMQYKIILKDIIQFTYLYKHSSREITPWYYVENNKVIESLTNGDYVHQYLGLNGDYNLPYNIEVNFTANYQWYKRRAEKQSSWRCGHTWYLDAAITWQPKRNLTLMSEYFLRYDKEPLLQGEKYGQSELLMFGAKASMLKNKLSMMLAMTIPTNAISKRIYNKVTIPDYQYVTWKNDKVNNTIVQLSIRYNIGKGRISKLQNTNNSEKEKEVK